MNATEEVRVVRAQAQANQRENMAAQKRGWAAGNQRNRGRKTESYFQQMGDLMFNAGIALVVKSESVWAPVMGTAADGTRGIVGARPSKQNAGVPDFFAVLGPAGGGRGLFFEAKECAGRRFKISDDKLLRPKQREWMDRVNGDWAAQAMRAPCFLMVRFPKKSKNYRLPWSVARAMESLDSEDTQNDRFLVGDYYLADLV